MIYLFAKAKFKGVVSIELSQISFKKIRANLNKYEALIISSKNALKALKKSEKELNLEQKIYAIGQNSAKKALKMGFKNVKFCKKANARDFFKEFKEELRRLKSLYLRAKKIAFDMSKALRAEGASSKSLICYEALYKEPRKDLSLKRPCVLIFTSPLSVSFFLKSFEFKKEDKLVAIGQSTAKALKAVCKNEIYTPKKASIKECVRLARSLATP
ncbi:uroporphyrinogen-III synthase [Campylobacter sp. MIT 99-7217]|uniref:uroporphyrinogen-III synthase n=1 Tax=Campylobacter sp. MIT 99-7217 TaxID=535091 RepID=UPI00115AC28E|nr:uroporphyrinogen-III synthase [Campylobacter sp. MIT 99-7217]TQR32444.1 uroporphyrinogen-III synthase [Campylobacter sp. MIT 99-7217]